jgi:tetratricopeptide (TPR) repeat protein
MAVRYIPDFEESKRRAQDEAYVEAMRGVHERFPADLEAATLYAESLFLLEPRRGTRDIQAPNIQRILAVLEQALAADIRHVGACHLLIHLTEATTDPGRAEACAEFIGNAIPGASHINHMPWDEPEPLPFAARHWLGAALLDAQRPADAERVFREDLEKHPRNGWALFGLKAALDAQGQPSEDVARDFEESWARADVAIQRSSPE